MVGGLAGAAAFDPVAARPLIALAPVGCFVAISLAPTPHGALLRALVFGELFYFGALHWLCTLYTFNYFAPLGIVLLAGYVALYPALIGYALRRWFRGASPVRRYLLFAALWLLLEYFRTLGRLAVPLGQLGHAWATWSWAIQIASILGEMGVSLLVLAAAGWVLSLGWIWTERRRRGTEKPGAGEPTARPRNALVASSIVVLVLYSHCLGSAIAWRDRARGAKAGDAPTSELRVALLQPNVDQITKFLSYASPNPEQRDDLSEQITGLQESMLALRARPDWDLIILPESAFTQQDFAANTALRERVGRMAQGAGADMFFGANRDVPPPNAEVYNSAYLVRENGAYDERAYDKTRLVPFGEYLPYFGLIPGLQEYVVGIGSFNEGREPTLFEASKPLGGEARTWRFGALICFESMFSAMTRAYSRKGADFLVVITNDAWYGLSAGPAHHHHLSRLRAVETRRWVLRCANTGISSIIDPAGEVRHTLGLDKRGFVEGSIKLRPDQPTTLFARFGHAWLFAPLVFCLWVFGRRFLGPRADGGPSDEVRREPFEQGQNRPKERLA